MGLIKFHISKIDKDKWDQCVQDVADIRAGKIKLPIAKDGEPGFSHNDFSDEYRSKLDSIEWYANKYVHPATHPASMITGLAQVAYSGDYNHLLNKPSSIPANGGNSDTVNGVRVTISDTAPDNPKINKELWIEPATTLHYIYTDKGWVACSAVWK